MKQTVALLGPPGSGKGAQAARLRERLGFAARHSSLQALLESLRWLAANGQVDVGGAGF